MIFRAQRENFWLLGMKISLEGIQEHLRNVNFQNICKILRYRALKYMGDRAQREKIWHLWYDNLPRNP